MAKITFVQPDGSTQTVDAGSLSDPVLIREDGTYLYTFTSVVDDIDFGPRLGAGAFGQVFHG